MLEASSPKTPNRESLGIQRLPVRGVDDITSLMSALREHRHLVALLGNWHDDAMVVSWDPLAVLAADADPFETLDAWSADSLTVAAQHGFGGGWIGALGYQLGNRLEDLGPTPPRPVPLHPHRLAFYDRVLVHRDNQWWFEQLTGIVEPEEEERRRRSFLDALSAAQPASTRAYRLGSFSSQLSAEEHITNVCTAKEAVAAGDLFQANVTQRLDATFEGSPLDLFLTGWSRLQPMYAAYIGWPGAEVSSFSPELFLRRSGRHVLTSPIKGTAPLDSAPDELANSVKDRAENVMIVDLMRNDLSKVCRPGTVHVPSLNRVEDHAVRHLVSDVVGELRPGIGDGTLVRHTFPPGSVTGAPKVAAVRLLNDIEPSAREIYTGAIGYSSPGAGLELSVAIRTFEHAPGRVWLGVGGGITTLSDPKAELAECRAKAEPLINAIGGTWPVFGEASVSAPGYSRTRAATRGVVTTTRRPNTTTTSQVRSQLRAGAEQAPRVLVIDNYDSFVHNLVHYLEQAGATTAVVRNDALAVNDVAELRRLRDLTHLVISPGPAAPADAGITVPVIRELAATTPILGVCLGHQAIGEAFGATIVRARHVVHGRSEVLTHDAQGVLAPLPFAPVVARYHSLAVDPASIPEWLEATSWSRDGELMGLRHKLYPHVEGLQWHPESILTDHGQAVLTHFLDLRAPVHRAARTRSKEYA